MSLDYLKVPIENNKKEREEGKEFFKQHGVPEEITLKDEEAEIYQDEYGSEWKKEEYFLTGGQCTKIVSEVHKYANYMEDRILEQEYCTAKRDGKRLSNKQERTIITEGYNNYRGEKVVTEYSASKPTEYNGVAIEKYNPWTKKFIDKMGHEGSSQYDFLESYEQTTKVNDVVVEEIKLKEDDYELKEGYDYRATIGKKTKIEIDLLKNQENREFTLEKNGHLYRGFLDDKNEICLQDVSSEEDDEIKYILANETFPTFEEIEARRLALQQGLYYLMDINKKDRAQEDREV